MTKNIFIICLFLFPQFIFASEANETKTLESRQTEKISLGDLSKEETNDSALVEGLGVIHVKDSVKHPKFGIGTIESIIQYETGVQILRIEFEEYGLKSLMASHAKLELIE